jgi:hypothetical protein
MISRLAHAHCSVARCPNTRAHSSPHSPRVFILDSGTTDPAPSTCMLRAARLNSTASHFSPHTRPPDMQVGLECQGSLVNTYYTSDLCRPRDRDDAQNTSKLHGRVTDTSTPKVFQLRHSAHPRSTKPRPAWRRSSKTPSPNLPTQHWRKTCHKILDDLDVDQDRTFALIQTDCARQLPRSPRPRGGPSPRHPTQRPYPATRPTTSTCDRVKMRSSRTTSLRAPSVPAINTATTKFWPGTVRSDSDADASSAADDSAAGANASDQVTEFLLPLWRAYRVCSLSL